MEYVLEAKGLCKTYKHYKALDNLNMHVPKGAIYGFMDLWAKTVPERRP